jgi:orotidine-5'-phosphate decarboxylase
MIHLSPGVQLPPAHTAADGASSAAPTPSTDTPATASRTGGDPLGQQYHSPDAIIRRQGSDVIIVGRAILKAPDIAAECVRYQRAGWEAYEMSLMPMETDA